MFASVVELYRASGRPQINGGAYSYDGPKNERLEAAIAACGNLLPSFGRFSSGPTSTNGNVAFTWALASNASAYFYQDVAHLVSHMQSIHRGLRPKNFYLLNADYAHKEPNPPDELKRLHSICDLITHLETLSGQVKEGTRTKPLTLFFMLPARDGIPPYPAKLTTEIEVASITGSPLSLEDLRTVVDPNLLHTSHYREKQALFRAAIAHFLGQASPKDYFRHLINAWPRVVEKFRYESDCYVANYSFENFTLKLAESQTDFASRLTKVLGDTATKFLALPLPFVALIGISRSSGIAQSYLVFAGAATLALLYWAQVRNQLLELNRIESSFELVFSRLKLLSPTPPSGNAAISLQKVIDGFWIQNKLVRRTLRVLASIALMPIAGGLFMLAYKFHPDFYAWIHNSIERIHPLLERFLY